MCENLRKYNLLQVFNRYLEKGGEEASVDRIFHTAEGGLSIEQCLFTSSDWAGNQKPPNWKQALWMFKNPSALRHLEEYHRKYQPDAWLIHNVFPVGSAAIFQKAFQLNIPAIYYIHNFRPFSVNGYLWANGHLATGGLRGNYWQEIRAGAWQNSRLKTAWFALTLTWLRRSGWLHAVKAWIAISDFMRETFIQCGIPAESIFTLRHFWRPLAEAPAEKSEGYFLFLGRLVEQKGLPMLLKTWEILRRRFPDSAPRLVICGEGPMVPVIQEATRENSLIEYRGQVEGEEKHRVIAHCEAMIAPSIWWEPLGLVTYEAYDYAKPMLAARSGGLTETVVDGESGFLHEPGNAEELAQQVMAVSENPARAVEMGRAGRRWLLANTGEAEWREKFCEIVRYAVEKQEGSKTA